MGEAVNIVTEISRDSVCCSVGVLAGNQKCSVRSYHTLLGRAAS